MAVDDRKHVGFFMVEISRSDIVYADQVIFILPEQTCANL